MRIPIVLSTAMLLPVPVLADGPRQHSGFYLNLSLGPSGTSMRDHDADARVEGGGGTLGVAVGGALSENLVLHGSLFVHGMDRPDVRGTNATRARVIDANLAGIGPGVTYFFMPLNLYLSGSILLVVGSVTVEDELDPNNRNSLSTKVGLGLDLGVGKEWWLSADWGLGVAGHLFTAGMKDDEIADGKSNWRAGGLAILLSATYN